MGITHAGSSFLPLFTCVETAVATSARSGAVAIRSTTRGASSVSFGSKSARGTEVAAMLCSLVESAKGVRHRSDRLTKNRGRRPVTRRFRLSFAKTPIKVHKGRESVQSGLGPGEAQQLDRRGCRIR